MYKSSKPLRIGYYIDDGYQKPIPAVQRGVIVAKEALEAAGHVLVQFQVPKVPDAMRIVTKGAEKSNLSSLCVNRFKFVKLGT